jgi:cytochrome c peroxidase
VRAANRFIAITLLAFLAQAAQAAPNAAEGKKLLEERKCDTCHHNKTMGDAKAIYLRKDRKATSWAKLKAQVAACNSQLNAGLFPEEEEHIAAYLNETYYKFPVK